jgi:hypothetical protein
MPALQRRVTQGQRPIGIFGIRELLKCSELKKKDKENDDGESMKEEKPIT